MLDRNLVFFQSIETDSISHIGSSLHTNVFSVVIRKKNRSELGKK